MVLVEILGKVPKYIEKHVEQIANKLVNYFGFTNDVTIVIVDTDYVETLAGGQALGLFAIEETGPIIYIASKLVQSFKKEYNSTKIEALHHLSHVLTHEFVHLKQFINGYFLTERGVEVTTYNICKKLGI